MAWLIALILGGLVVRSGWLVARAPRAHRARLALRQVGLILLFYVGLIAMLLLLEKSFLYHPYPAGRGWVDAGELQPRDVWLNSAAGDRLHAWWCPVAKEDWVLIYCHGNAGNLSHRRDLVRRWQRELNASVLIFDYPGYGKSEGKPSEAGCYAAAHAAYDWLTKERQVAAEKLVLFGKSLGGAVAAELALARPHRALILQSSFTSVPDLAHEMFPFLPGRWLVRSRYDTRERLTGYTGPLFIAHGDQDDLIPFSHGEELFAACPSANKRFYCIARGGHNDLADQTFYRAVKEFLDNER
jgi:fermentation-respiration switch protein FrsA (DUF1100 family)